MFIFKKNKNTRVILNFISLFFFFFAFILLLLLLIVNILRPGDIKHMIHRGVL